MKKILSTFILLSLIILSSCENTDMIVDQNSQTQESESIKSTLLVMKDNFDNAGNVNPNTNPAGNVTFDFCFDFVFPITLSYNNDISVVVNSFNGLVSVIANSTDQLFIDAVSFPFDVETYDANTDSIILVSINNESDFENLLNTCSFNSPAQCVCDDEFEPVCVNLTDTNGNSFTISYPNECEAICDGFSESDFSEPCMYINYFVYGDGCFDLNFPVEIILENGNTVSINSNIELANAMYNQYFLNFVYPISVTLEEDNSTVSLSDAADLDLLLGDCFYGIDSCDECGNLPIDPVCVEYTNEMGEVFQELYTNSCYAECEGFDSSDIVVCDDSINTSCTENEILNEITSCSLWDVTVGNSNFIYEFQTSPDIVTITNQGGNVVASGPWEIGTEPSSGNTYLSFDVSPANFSDTWLFYGCAQDEDLNIISSKPNINGIEPDC